MERRARSRIAHRRLVPGIPVQRSLTSGVSWRATITRSAAVAARSTWKNKNTLEISCSFFCEIQIKIIFTHQRLRCGSCPRKSSGTRCAARYEPWIESRPSLCRCCPCTAPSWFWLWYRWGLCRGLSCRGPLPVWPGPQNLHNLKRKINRPVIHNLPIRQ